MPLADWELNLLHKLEIVGRRPETPMRLRTACNSLAIAHLAVRDGDSSVLQARHLRKTLWAFGLLADNTGVSRLEPADYVLVAGGLYLLTRILTPSFAEASTCRHIVRNAARLACGTERRVHQQSPMDALLQDYLLTHIVHQYAEPWSALTVPWTPQTAALARNVARIGMVAALIQWPFRGIAMPSALNVFFALYPMTAPLADNDLDTGAMFAVANTWSLGQPSTYFDLARPCRPAPLGDIEYTLALMLDEHDSQALEHSYAAHRAHPEHPLLALAYEQTLAHYNRDTDGSTAFIHRLAATALSLSPCTARAAMSLPRLLALATAAPD